MWMYGETVLFSRELHKDELSRGLQNLTRYSNRYIHMTRNDFAVGATNGWRMQARFERISNKRREEKSRRFNYW